MLLLVASLMHTWNSLQAGGHDKLYWFVFFGSAVIVASAVFYGVTSEGFERWRESMVEKFDRSKLGKHMQRASTTFAPKKKNRDTGGR